MLFAAGADGGRREKKQSFAIQWLTDNDGWLAGWLADCLADWLPTLDIAKMERVRQIHQH